MCVKSLLNTHHALMRTQIQTGLNLAHAHIQARLSTRVQHDHMSGDLHHYGDDEAEADVNAQNMNMYLCDYCLPEALALADRLAAFQPDVDSAQIQWKGTCVFVVVDARVLTL